MKLYCYRLKRIQQTDHCTQQTAKAVFLRSPRELRCRILQCGRIRVKYASLPHGISERTVQFHQIGDLRNSHARPADDLLCKSAQSFKQVSLRIRNPIYLSKTLFITVNHGL